MIGNIVAGTFSAGVAPVFSSYESIATVTVGSGGQSTVTFSSIPSTYKHLQIRSSHTLLGGEDNLYMKLNTSINSTYYHYLFGNGSSAVAGATTGNLYTIQFGNASNIFYGNIVDILDYGSTTKNKTIRTLGGADFNGSGGVYLGSNLYATTSAITSITIGSNSYNIGQYSHFALYGIKD